MLDSLFPLPLTLWEEFFVVDDYDSYPGNFMTRVRCSGRLDTELLMTALYNCVRSHPLFDCRIGRHRRRLVWERVGERPLSVEFVAEEASDDFENLVLPPMKKFDVHNDRLWRIRVISGRNRTNRAGHSENEKVASGDEFTDIIVELHHSLCDGLGAIQFISDVAREIHDLHAREDSPDQATRRLRNPETDIQLLRNRGHFHQTWKERIQGLPFHYKSILASLRLVFAKVSPLTPIDSVRELLERSKADLGYEKILLSAMDSSRLRRKCRLNNTTVNSCLTAEIFRAVHDWKKNQGHPPFNTLRIMMPFNERKLADLKLPACNRVSLSPFTRTAKQIKDPGLLSSIEKTVKLIKKGRLGINFHRALWFCKTFFRSLKALARTDRVGTTCVFANVGNLHTHLGLPPDPNGTRCGPLVIRDIDLVPPLRIGTGFALTLHEFNGESRLGIHYDSSWIRREEAKSFFGYLKERILAINDSQPEREA